MLFLIPLRRYFVRETHGQFPYPEATAITEVLITGEKGGSQARLLLQATAIAGVYDFFVTTFQVWKEFVDLQFIPAVRALAEQSKVAFSFDAISFILGLGYVMGLRSSMILCAGGFLANFVLVPLIWMIGSHFPDAVYPATTPIAQMTANQIFRSYVRFIGVGAIATAGIFGIIKSLRIVAGSFAIAARAFRHGEAEGVERTDRDISGHVDSGRGGRQRHRRGGVSRKLWGLAGGDRHRRGADCAFLVLLHLGGRQRHRHDRAQSRLRHDHADHHHFRPWSCSASDSPGTTGMFFVMAIAGMVCTALSVSGQTITDLKTGYWLGSTPAAQEKVKFLGVIAASVAAGLTIVLLARAFQFGDAVAGDLRAVLPSPQAAIMSALVEGFMSQQPVAMVLFGAGAMIDADSGNAGRARVGLRAGHVSAARTEHARPGRRHHRPFRRQAFRVRS